jgi:hypothetical protein
LLDEVGKSQPRHEPRYLPRANQVCSASETRHDKLAANYLAFIQCPLHLCRLTAPECLASDQVRRLKSYHSLSMTQGQPLVRLVLVAAPALALGTTNAPCESLRLLVEHPKRT